MSRRAMCPRRGPDGLLLLFVFLLCLGAVPTAASTAASPDTLSSWRSPKSPDWIWYDSTTKRIKQRANRVELEPGEAVSVQLLGAHSVGIRFERQAPAALSTYTLSAYASADSALWVRQTLEVQPDLGDPIRSTKSDEAARVSMRWRRPITSPFRVLRIQHDPAADHAIAFDISRDDPVLDLGATQVRVFPGPGPPSEVTVNDREPVLFWLLSPSQPWDIDLVQLRRLLSPSSSGLNHPLRLRVDSRPLFDEKDSSDRLRYRLRFELGQEPPIELDHIGTLGGDSLRVNGEIAPVGRLDTGFVEILPGARDLRVHSNREQLLRLTLRRPAPLAFPKLNARSPAVQSLQLPLAHAPRWSSDRAHLERVLLGGDYDQWDSVALQLARDNGRRGAPLIGIEIAERLAERFAEPRLVTRAAELRQAHSAYRAVLPRSLEGRDQLLWSHFLILPLVDQQRSPSGIGRLGSDAALPSPRAPDRWAGRRLQRLSEAAFVRPAVSRVAAHIFEIPDQGPPPRVRVLMRRDPDSGTAPLRVWLAPDPHTQAIELLLTPQLLPKEALTASPVRSALAQLASADATEGALELIRTLGAASRWQAMSSLVEVAQAEVRLPPGTRRLALWAETADLRVAVQFWAPRRSALSEGEMLATLDALATKSDPQTILRLLLAKQAAPKEAAQARLFNQQVRLFNHWIPLKRFLSSRATSFGTGLRPLEAPTGRRPSQESASSSAQRARAFAAQGHHLQALEIWSRLERELGLDPGIVRGKATSLRASGQGFLAERFLRQAALFAETAVSDAAVEMLARRRQEHEDLEGILNLWSSLAHERRQTRYLPDLVRSLVATGRFGYALAVGALLRPQEQPEELLVAATIEGWWQTFEHQLAALESPEKAQIWRARQAWLEADLAQADEHLRNAGESAKKYRASFATGETIRKRLDAAQKEPENDSEALSSWSNWWHRQPGPRIWRNASRWVVDAAGSSLLEVLAQQSHSLYLRATPDKPLGLRVLGPARVRIEARPVHSPESPKDAELNGWIEIHRDSNAQPVSRLAILSNRTSPGLRFLDPEGGQVGSAEGVLIEVGPGVAHLRISSPRLDLLARVLSDEPLLPLGILPPPRPGTRASAEAALGVAAWPAGDTAARGASAWLTEHLYQAEHGTSDERALALAKGAALFSSHQQRSGLRPLYSHLSRGAAWQRVQEVESSAGIRRLEIKGWEPETPSLRLRKALLPNLEEDALIVTGSQRLGYETHETKDVEYQLRFDLLPTPPLSAQTTVAVYQLDDETTELTLDRDHPTTRVTIPVATGAHTFRFWIKQPRTHHTLRIRIAKASRGQREGDFKKTVARTTTRSYHAATHRSPLRLRVRGPSWLRVDQRSEQSTLSSYRLIQDAEWRTLELKPRTGQEQALYRVFRLAADAGALAPVASALSTVSVEPLPALPTSLREFAESALTVHTPVEPSSPEVASSRSATWSLSTGMHRRRLLEEDVVQGTEDVVRGTGPDEFTQALIERRRLSNSAETYGELSLFGRAREDGERSLGIGSHWRHDGGERGGLVFNLDLGGLVQDLPDSSEWAAAISAGLSRRFKLGEHAYHRLELGGFARRLSLDAEPASSLRVDQDVFSQYKLDHRHGWTLAENFGFRPTLDTELWARAGVRSNQELGDLDQGEIQLGLRQLLASFRLDLRLRWAHFFADADRRQSIDRYRASLRAFWERWNRHFGRWELGARLSFDFRQDELTGSLSLSRHFSAGRGLADFRPAAADFRSLRRSRIADPPNPP